MILLHIQGKNVNFVRSKRVSLPKESNRYPSASHIKRNIINMKRLLFIVAIFAFSHSLATYAQSAKTASINIDSRTRYQHVSGFGGFTPSPTWQYWLNDSQIDMLFGKGDDQLGLNIARLYIANNKNYWNGGVSNAKRLNKHGVFIFASPWSPPASWKSNNSDSNGGSLLSSHYADWANFLNDYQKYMRQQGAPIDAVSIQNEADYTTSYQSCVWTGQQLATFLKNYGHIIECKIIAPESVHFTRNMHEPMLNDAEACAELDILGGHFYGWDGSSYPLAEEKGKEVWMTEYLINERQQNDHQNINWQTDGFLFARSVNDAMLANMSAWVHYSLKRYYGLLGDGEYGTENNKLTKRGYILSHYAKYVSGTTRVRHSLSDATGKLTASAYISQTGDSVVVMLLNPSANTYNTTLTLPFYTKTCAQVTTTGTENAKRSKPAIGGETYEPVVAVEPWSVNTYIYIKSSERTDVPTDDPTADKIFEDGYAASGADIVPTGWQAKSEGGIRKAGNYSLGPRIMSFSREGAMPYAFYFRTDANADGYVSYGEDAAHPLTLQPGHYTLTYSTHGWKALPTMTGSVELKSGSEVQTLASSPKAYVSDKGSSVSISNPADYTIEFDVETAANYVLRWTIGKSKGGLTEGLLGNVLLVRNNTSGIADVIIDTNATPVVYDLMGRKVQQAAKGVYVINGKKTIIK